MFMLTRDFFHCGLLVAVCVASLNAKLQASVLEELEIQQEWTLKSSKKSLEKFGLESFVADPAEWQSIWEKFAADQEAPKVDFEKSIVLVHVADAADPNRVRFSVKANEGIVELMALTTRMGFESSSQAKVTFLAIDSTGLKSIRFFDPDSGKMLERPLDSAATRVNVLIPKTCASFDGQKLDLRLYEYDPLLADVGADLVGQVTLQVSHTQGTDSKLAIRLGQQHQLRPKRSYYVTLFILQGDARTHMGEQDGERGLCHVLTEGNPRQVTMIVRSLK
jgi:hypothetical protein